MKKLLVLGGGSVRNREWGVACSEFFKDSFDVTCFVHYDHWETGEKNINFDIEVEKIAETVNGAATEGEWYVFAKSIGSILTLKAVDAGAINPAQCVFFGMPLEIVADSVMKDGWSLLSTFDIDSLAFHNDNDPTANCLYTQEKLAAFAPDITLNILSGDTHDYLHFESYKDTIHSFLKL
jgi:hypothetical protein